ncbi:hypothetical protein BDW74DRAFT_164222 [Aspergillus multicolor]|uniref:ATP/GTP-binding protein n=1 Tax=Aspergillus multicolor TaxID=41759 RepID=UPI003CCE2462
MMSSRSLYIIGAQCTGKTTLLHALQDAFSREDPSLRLRPITEVARNVLQQHNFTRDDINYIPERALELQQLILSAQYDEESKTPTDRVLCDRSGADPIAYAMQYGPPDAYKALEASPEWHYLRDRLRESLVVVCPPHQEWLVDDGTRLIPRSWAEWERTHLAFLHVLESNSIGFHTIPAQLVVSEQRVDFVLRLWGSLS